MVVHQAQAMTAVQLAWLHTAPHLLFYSACGQLEHCHMSMVADNTDDADTQTSMCLLLQLSKRQRAVVVFV